MQIGTVLIWVKGANRSKINALAIDLEKVLPEGADIRKTYVDEDSNADVLKIVDIVFYVTIGIMMFLCFFSLMASMTANIYD